MQLLNFFAFSALFVTAMAAVPGVLNLRGDESDDISELVARSNCANAAKISRPSKFDKEGCVPDKSKGFLSAHNCVLKGGNAYLCVQSGQSFCISGSANVKKTGYENGECFV